MRLATVSVGLVSPRSTWDEHRRADAGALGEVAQAQVHALAQRAHARSRRGWRPPYKRTLSHTATLQPRTAHSRSLAPRTLERVPEPLLNRPDVLVLAAGGTLGEAWMRGLLDGDRRRHRHRLPRVRVLRRHLGRLDRRRVPGRGPTAAAPRRARRATRRRGRRRRRPARRAGRRSRAGRGAASRAGLARRTATPFAPLALATTAPGGAVARAAALAAVPKPTRSMPGLGRLVAESGAEFDGRLRIAAVDRKSRQARDVRRARRSRGHRSREAVLASCAIPWVFAPVEIDGREYVDGGVWSPSNLDATPAPARHRGPLPQPDRGGAAAELASPTPRRWPSRSRSRRAARACGRSRPDRDAAEAMGSNLMDRRRAAEALAAGYAQGRALAE